MNDIKYIQGKSVAEYTNVLEEAIRKLCEIARCEITRVIQLSNKNGWLVCSDFTPPDSECILIFDGVRVMQAIYYEAINGYWIAGDLFIEGKNVNYWMPLPEPPEKEASR